MFPLAPPIPEWLVSPHDQYRPMKRSPASASPRMATGPPPEFEVRPVRAREEFIACVELQRDTWGRSFSDVVPLSMLQITARMKGVVTGAFASDGALLGFVYGVTGLRRGELAHWSHMLAVRPEARDRGIGRRLKLAQKEELRAVGVRTMYWTYDPLVARNAHLNLNLLGAEVDEFVPNMYGESDSLLHQLGTDRFIVRWDLTGEATPSRPPPHAPGLASHPAPLLWAPGTPGAEWPPNEGADAPSSAGHPPAADQPSPPAGDPPDAIAVRIPRDIEVVEARSVREALAWRHSTRAAFVRFLPLYRIRAFTRGDRHGAYLLARAP